MVPFSQVHSAFKSLAAHIYNMDILLVDGSKACGRVSKAWVDLTWFRSGGREKDGKYLQN